jgi:hypothetical protein
MTTGKDRAAPSDTDECDDRDELFAQLARFEAEIAAADNRRNQTEVEARALLKLKKAAVPPELILKLLRSCDVPSSLLSLISDRIAEPGRRAELVRAREAAMAFEANYTARHGRPPSVQAVSKHVFGTDTQRKKVDGWRREKYYNQNIANKIAALAQDADQRRREAQKNKIAAREKRRPELMGLMEAVLKRS